MSGSAPEGHDAASPDAPPSDTHVAELDLLRDELDGLDRVPVADRVARFEHANAVLVRELGRLDEV